MVCQFGEKKGQPCGQGSGDEVLGGDAGVDGVHAFGQLGGDGRR